MQQAGADYMHVGVAMTASQANKSMQLDILDDIAAALPKTGVTQSDRARRWLTQISQSIDETFAEQNGAHAANVVRLMDGSWVMQDVNYGSIEYTNRQDNHAFDDWYEMAADLSAVAPSTEHMVLSLEGSHAAPYAKLVNKMAKELLPIEIVEDRLEAALASPYPLDGIKAYMLESLADDWSIEMQTNHFMAVSGQSKAQYVDDVLDDVLKKYVFADVGDDNDFAKAITRCQTDAAYRARRVEDLLLAPLYLVLRLDIDLMNYANNPKVEAMFPPALVEAGMPEYRIGAAVLSDFAVHCSSEMPTSFWATYWSSQLVLHDHLAAPGASAVQKRLSEDLVKSAESQALRYTINYSIMEKFLE